MEEEEEYNDDPGAIFVLNNNDEIHNLLALPSVANILPPLQQGRKKFHYYKLYKIYTLYNYIYIYILHVGGTPEQSRNNLHSWIDTIALRISGGDCLVYSMTGRRIPGHYHKMRSERHSQFEAEIAQHTLWIVECWNAGLSAGLYISVESGGVGRLTMINKDLGPFINY